MCFETIEQHTSAAAVVATAPRPAQSAARRNGRAGRRDRAGRDAATATAAAAAVWCSMLIYIYIMYYIIAKELASILRNYDLFQEGELFVSKI